MCGIIDTWKTMPGKEQKQHQGLMTVTGDFYPEMENVVRQVSSRRYVLASAGGGRSRPTRIRVRPLSDRKQ